MRTVSKRLVRALAVVAVVTLLGAQVASAAPNDDREIGQRSVFHRLTRLVTHILDELSWPRP